MNNDKEIFDDFVQEYNIETVLWTYITIQAKDIIKGLYNNRGWKLIYFDDKAAIFIKDAPKNRRLIDKFYIDLERWSPPVADLKTMPLSNIYPEPYLKRALVFKLLGLEFKMFQEAKEALKILPSCWEAYNLIGRYYFNNRQFDLAFENFRLQAIYGYLALDTRFDLASIYLEFKNFDKAIAQLKKIIKLNKKYTKAYEKLGDIYSRRNSTEASIYYKKALELEPRNSRILEKLKAVQIAPK